jgi:hypothetical protein
MEFGKKMDPEKVSVNVELLYIIMHDFLCPV